MSQLLDQEAFAAHIEAATRRAGYEIEKREGIFLHVMVHEEPLRCNLTNAYKAYQASPDRLHNMVEAHLSALQKVPPTPPPPTEEQAAKSLLPLLQQPPWLKQARLQHTIPVVSRPFVTGVVITYVFDYPDSRAYINQDIMAQIMKNGSGHDEIHEYALENLRHRTTRHSYKTYGRGERKLIVCDTKDGYAATRVLLPELMEKWAKRFRGRMLIGIPNRDFLIAFSERHPSGVESIARQVRRDAKKRHYPLSSRLLRWQNGKIAEYRPVQ